MIAAKNEELHEVLKILPIFMYTVYKNYFQNIRNPKEHKLDQNCGMRSINELLVYNESRLYI